MRQIRELLLSLLITAIVWIITALIIWIVFTNDLDVSYETTFWGVASFGILYSMSRNLHEADRP